ncbi:MAG: polysaccharide deacetylase family protein [Candidatus Poribacteria bacterium]|nr:polysaccharide deacetylase family protein [Candidatus Poribacteria bacterium]
MNPSRENIVHYAGEAGPFLITCVDVEEEFNWNAPFSRHGYTTVSLRSIGVAKRIFDKFHIRPIYFVDYPVAKNDPSVAILSDILNAGEGEIGAQLHPWVNPPFDEDLTVRNSYPGNLPPWLEGAKLRLLTEIIQERFGIRPTVYKAGRYGVGENTKGMLAENGYRIDMSVRSHCDLSDDDGPDFRRITPSPYWFQHDQHRILELPLTCGYFGRLGRWGLKLQRTIDHPAARRFHVLGILSYLGLLNRATITPEGIPLREAKAVTKALHARGLKVFILAFHSPSLEPGNTPYVRNHLDLARLVEWLEEFLYFFSTDMAGQFVTPQEFLDLVSRDECA